METARHDSIDFFLGATTPAGFKGYFEPLRHEPGMQMYLIKSGPGCGKSTLMKRLARAAEQRGELTQRIHCASDPDSLDGVILPGQHRAIVDATAPHVVEPDAPGADEVVVSLYHTIDTEKLHQCTDEVKALFARNALLRSRAESLGVTEVKQQGDALLFYRRSIDMKQVSALVSSLKKRVMVNAGANPYVSVKLQGTPLETLSEVLELLSGDKKNEAASGKGNRT